LLMVPTRRQRALQETLSPPFLALSGPTEWTWRFHRGRVYAEGSSS
jgi:hypothetical protein